MTTAQAATEFCVATGILSACVAYALGLGEKATVAADKRTPFLVRCLVVPLILSFLALAVAVLSSGMDLMRKLGI